MSDTPTPAEEGNPSVDWSALRELVSDDVVERDRRRRSVALACAILAWIVAFVLVWITWDQIAARNVVADQLPFLASSGLAAIVAAIIGGAALVVAYLPASSSPR